MTTPKKIIFIAVYILILVKHKYASIFTDKSEVQGNEEVKKKEVCGWPDLKNTGNKLNKKEIQSNQLLVTTSIKQ